MQRYILFEKNIYVYIFYFGIFLENFENISKILI